MTTNPVIYACTHIGWDDAEVAYCALRDPSWLLLGDPRKLYRSIDGLILWMNGVICCDTVYKQDVCKLIGLKMDVDESKVRFVCNAEYGDEYEKCPVYQSR